MSSHIVEVCRIDDVRVHPNADALDIATIKGWQCVVLKGRYHAGSIVTYVPIDSVMPAELSDRLGITKYLVNGRVGCARLRGEPSFGVIIDRDNDAWDVGTDVREHYGIEKYKQPVPSAVDALPNETLFTKYTDIENARNFPGVFREYEPVVITEKIHGKNCRVGVIDGRFMAGSRDIRRAMPNDGRYESSVYWCPFAIKGVMELLTEMSKNACQVILFGEVFGRKIQSLHYGYDDTVGFRAFDLFVDGKYFDFDTFEEWCRGFDIPIVPILQRGPLGPHDMALLAEGKTTLEGNHIREGVVVRPIFERYDPQIGRVIVKYISDEYLLSKGISDNEDA
jgi:RNA ligase (TIGR02306 family)